MLKKYKQFKESIETQSELPKKNRNIDKEQNVFGSKHAGSKVLLNMPFIRNSEDGYEIKDASEKNFNNFWRPEFDKWVPLSYVTLCRYLLYRWLYRYGNPHDDKFFLDIEGRLQDLKDGVKKLKSNDKYIKSFEIGENGEPEVEFKFKTMAFGELIFVRDSLVRGKLDDNSVKAFSEIVINDAIYKSKIEPFIPGNKDDKDNLDFLNRFYINSTKIFNTRNVVKMYDSAFSLITNTAKSEMDSIRILSLFFNEHFSISPEHRTKSTINLKSSKGITVKVINITMTAIIVISKIAPYKISILNTYLESDISGDYDDVDYLVFYSKEKDKIYILDTNGIDDIEFDEMTTKIKMKLSIDDKNKLNDKLFIMSVEEDDSETDEEFED